MRVLVTSQSLTPRVGRSRPLAYCVGLAASLCAAVLAGCGSGYAKVSTGPTPTAPVLAYSPASLSFSAVVGTTSAAQTVTVSNTGNATLTLSSVAIAGATVFADTTTCGSALAAGASCTIAVTFSPTAVGTVTANVTITDNAAGSPQGLMLTGTGTASPTPAVTLSPTALTFAATTQGASTAAQTVTLTNSGTATLMLSSIAIGGSNATSFTQTNNCGATVAANASCTLSVVFTPAAIGALSATLTIADNAAGSPQSVALMGTGTAVPTPSVMLSPAALTFAATNLGSSAATQSVTLTNTGTGTLTISGISISGTNATSFSDSSTCGTTLAAGSSCAIVVTFTPTAIGTLTASLSVTDNAVGSPQSVALTGTGVGVATATLSPTSLTFPSTVEGVSATAQSVTLTNSGTGALTISSIAISGTNATSFTQTNNCGAAVAVSASCTIMVTFTPATAGALSATLAVADNTSGSPQSVSLSGSATAVPQPAATLSPNTIDFGSVAVNSASMAQTVTLSNSGTATLTITSISITGTNASSFSETNACGSALAAGSACTIMVSFAPTAMGALSASLAVVDNAPNSPESAALSGIGVGTAALTITPTSLGFGTVATGSSETLSSMVTNTGTATVTFTTIGSTSTTFVTTNTCGTSLAVGASCTVSVTFKPTVTGTQTASIVLTDNVAGSPQTIAVSGTGGSGTVPLPTPTQATILYGVVTTGTASPVSGATVKAYSVSTTSTLLATATTGTDGSFYFYKTGNPTFTCPSATVPVYLVATGGTPQGVGSANPQLAMFTMVGPCGTMTSAVVNEATTVAGVALLINYFGAGGTTLSYNSTDASAFAALVTEATEVVNPATGAVPGTLPAGASADVAKINGVADILYTCTHSKGGKNGDGSACGNLLAATNQTVDISNGITATTTFTALYNLGVFNTPWIHGVSNLLPASGNPFAPTWPVNAPPMDLTARYLAPTSAPTFAISAGSVTTGGVTVTIKSASPGAAIYYTLDGSTPTPASTVYLAPIVLSSTATITAIAQDHTFTASAPTSATYGISGPHITLSVANATVPVAASTAITGTITLSAPAAGSTTIALTSGAPNAVKLGAASVVIAAGSSSGSFTFYAANAGTAQLTATASGFGTGTVAVRATLLTSGNQTTTKVPIYGFTAVNYQGFETSKTQAVDNGQEEINQAPGAFSATAINAKWSDIEPSPGSFDFSSIELGLTNLAAYNKANSANVTAKLRIFNANVTPAWLTAEENGGIIITTNSVNYFDGLFWSQDYREQWSALMNALSAEYDTRAVVEESVGSMCANSTDEPFVLGFTTYSTGANGTPSMLAQGYTDGKRETCIESQGLVMDGWKVTPVYYPFGGFATIDTGTQLGRQGFAIANMRYLNEQKGAQAIVGENSLQPEAAKMSENDEYPIYQEFPILTALGSSSATQTALQGKLDSVCTNTGGDDFACWDSTVQYGVQVTNREIEMWPDVLVTFQVGGKGQQDFTAADLLYWKGHYF